MPYRKEQFVNDGIYHIILRGLDDNLIFKDINDYYRGIFSIYEFNNSIPVNIFNRRRDRLVEKKFEKPCETRSHTLLNIDKRDKLVDIFCFCFMPNHMHLLLKQLQDEGVTKFMRKVGAGYGRYLNAKYARKGYVFQNRFRSIIISDDNQFQTIFRYIHANPISLIEPGFKDVGISNPKKATKFLEEYKWSSYKDYTGIKNFPSVTERDFVLETMGGIAGCREALEDWVSYKSRLGQFQDILLE